jgi:RimJ/RimL family protein N-acetyltransferase
MLRTQPPSPAIPILETPRLRLRSQTLADYPASCALWSDPDVARYTVINPSTPEDVWARLLRNAGHWTLLGFGTWLVETQSTPETPTPAFVGEVGLFHYNRALIAADGTLHPLTTPEIGWALIPAMYGRGYATEAATAVLDWARDRFTASEISCIIAPQNTPSLNVAAKLGFTPRESVTYRDHPTLVLTRPLR